MITVTKMEKQKIFKILVGIFKNMGGNIPGGNFRCGSFPDTKMMYQKFKKIPL